MGERYSVSKRTFTLQRVRTPHSVVGVASRAGDEGGAPGVRGDRLEAHVACVQDVLTQVVRVFTVGSACAYCRVERAGVRLCTLYLYQKRRFLFFSKNRSRTCLCFEMDCRSRISQKNGMGLGRQPII